MKAMGFYRVGIIGAGNIVRQRHAPGLREIRDVQITAVANARQESARHFVAEWAPGASIFADWRELIPHVDVVWIGAGPFLHAPATIAALEAGKHVFCQARMSTDLDSALRMNETARAHPDLLTALCPPPYGLEIDTTIRRLLREMVVGTLQSARLVSRSDTFRDPALPLHWRQDPAVSGKNILTLGIYAEILHRWLGRFTVRSARGHTETSIRNGREVLIPDELYVEAEFASGLPASFEFSGISDSPGDFLELSGSDGCLRIDFAPDRITLVNPTGEREIQPLPGERRLWRVEADFFDALRDPSLPKPRPDFDDGVAYMEVVDRVWELLDR